MTACRKARILVALATAAGVAGATAAWSKRDRHGMDQDQVLEAVKRGEIKPLVEVLAAVEKAVPGRVIKVEVERRQGRLVYELKIIGDLGRVREVSVDAGTLEILKVE